MDLESYPDTLHLTNQSKGQEELFEQMIERRKQVERKEGADA